MTDRRRWAIVVCLMALVIPAFSMSSSSAIAANQVDEQMAAEAAYQFSLLESLAEFERLYDQMHPDAQILIPRTTVVYWYTQYFAPLGPQPATITGVRFVDWTWPVNGRTYANTAEISFEQRFDNQAPLSDVVRLVEGYDGQWHWFFGRSLEFIRSMEREAYDAGWLPTGTSIPERSGIDPQHLFGEALSAIGTVSPSCFASESALDALPLTIQGNAARSPTHFSDPNRWIVSYIADPRRDFPAIIVNFIYLPEGESPESRVMEIVQSMADWNGPPYSLPPQGLNQDLVPTSNYLVTYYEEFTEPAGHVPVLTWGSRSGNTLIGVVGPAGSGINELVAAWAAALHDANTSCRAR